MMTPYHHNQAAAELMVPPTAADAPERRTVLEVERPATPTLCSVANALPATTFPIEAYHVCKYVQDIIM